MLPYSFRGSLTLVASFLANSKFKQNPTWSTNSVPQYSPTMGTFGVKSVGYRSFIPLIPGLSARAQTRLAPIEINTARDVSCGCPYRSEDSGSVCRRTRPNAVYLPPNNEYSQPEKRARRPNTI